MPRNKCCRWSKSRPQTQTSSLIYQPSKTGQIQGECWPSHRMDDRRLVLWPWPAAAWWIQLLPKFPIPRGGSACADGRQKFTLGEFKCCFPKPLKVNDCTETVSLQGHLLAPFLSTRSFGRENNNRFPMEGFFFWHLMSRCSYMSGTCLFS